MKLVVIGSSNMDLVIRLPRIPAVGETILGGESSMVFGGKGANQAVAALRSAGQVAFITKVGDDLFGANMKNHFRQEGFDTDLILSDEEKPTGIAQIFVSEKGENSIAVAPGANMNLTPEDLEPHLDLIRNSNVLLLQLETPLSTVEYLAELAHLNKIKLILNPAPAQDLSAELLKRVWLLTPNETEAKLLTGIEVVDFVSAKLAAKKLLDFGVENVIVTLGDKGCLLYRKSGEERFSSFKVRAVDSTAAGDVFNGTLASAVAMGKPFNEAIVFASAAAGISVTRAGAQPSIPNLSEINDFLKNNTME